MHCELEATQAMEKQLPDNASQQENPLKDAFMEKFHGRLIGILRWEQLAELWQTLHAGSSDEWFIYHIGEAVPVTACQADQFDNFIVEIDKLLRHDHQERYCGIVYVDDKTTPEFIKIYDPNNLGQVCGSNGAPPPLPGWIISKTQPIDLEAAMPPPGNRRKWWQKIFT